MMSSERVTFDDLEPGDTIRYLGERSWWTVTSTERGTYPIMVNLWLKNFINPGPPFMVSKLGRDEVVRIETA